METVTLCWYRMEPLLVNLSPMFTSTSCLGGPPISMATTTLSILRWNKTSIPSSLIWMSSSQDLVIRLDRSCRSPRTKIASRGVKRKWKRKLNGCLRFSNRLHDEKLYSRAFLVLEAQPCVYNLTNVKKLGKSMFTVQRFPDVKSLLADKSALQLVLPVTRNRPVLGNRSQGTFRQLTRRESRSLRLDNGLATDSSLIPVPRFVRHGARDDFSGDTERHFSS